MEIYRGTVKNGAVLIEGSVRLPEGIVVEVHVPDANDRRGAFDRVLAHRQLNAGYAANMTEMLAEERRAREERADGWLRRR